MESTQVQPYSRDAGHPPVAVLLARSLGVGGAERQITVLAAGLLERGWRVRVVLFYGGGAFEDTLKAGGVPVDIVGKQGRWDVAGFLSSLVSLLRAISPDVVYSFLEVPNLLASAVRPLLGRCAVVWGVRSSDVDVSRYGLVHAAVFLGQSPASRFPDAIIYNSAAGRRAAEERGFCRERGVVVPNGIDVAKFAPDSRARAVARGEWRVPDGDALVGMLGRTDPMKDHATFFRAAALVAATRSEVSFVCSAGSEDERVKVEEAAAAAGAKGRLIIAGPGNDVGSILNALDVLVLSSAYGEGFPNIVGEAMACGVPCVVTDVGDAAAIVGRLGVVVPPGRDRRLAKAIVNTLDIRHDPSAIRERIVSNFSLDRMIDGTANVLEAAVRNSRSGR